MSKLGDVVDNAQEVYSPAISAPAPSHTDLLDFGNASTAEGLLKKSVLCPKSSAVTAATGDNAESTEIVPGSTGALKRTGFLT